MTEGRTRTLVTFFVSLAVGLIGGLVFAWFISPVEYTGVEPAELKAEFRPIYLQLVSESFAFENDWTRARFRLDVLRDPNVAQQIVQVTERAIAEGRSAPMLRALSKLSDRLGKRTAAMIVYLATPVPTVARVVTPTPLVPPTPVPTATPSPTFVLPDTPTPLPTFTPTPLPPPVYLLIGRERICEPGSSQVRVLLEDEKGKGLAGIEVWITWENGADRLVTGLKPEKGAGYGDFDMQPNIAYAIAVAESALPVVTGIRTEQCPSSEPTQTVFASWQLTFRPVPPTPTPSPTPGPSPTPTASSTHTVTPGPSPTLTMTPTVTRKP
jgi:hypothetical protein